MLKIENTEVFGWEAAIRGARNPLNSWEKSDSRWQLADGEVDYDGEVAYSIGENDLKLMKNLAKAGSDHAKYLRMINVTVDITAPLYWWKEFDTYKVGTVANSCSTMHKIHAKEFTIDDFSHEHLSYRSIRLLGDTIDTLNDYQYIYLDHTADDSYVEEDGRVIKKKDAWWQMIQLLPSSYNQKRTVQLNYEVLRHMYFARRNHKLDCWHTLCNWMLTLPYFKELCVDVVEDS